MEVWVFGGIGSVDGAGWGWGRGKFDVAAVCAADPWGRRFSGAPYACEGFAERPNTVGMGSDSGATSACDVRTHMKRHGDGLQARTCLGGTQIHDVIEYVAREAYKSTILDLGQSMRTG